MYNQSLEFLGSSIRLLGFYVINPLMIFLDNKYINIIIPSNGESQKYDIHEIFRYLDPVAFYIKPIKVLNRTDQYLILC